MAYFPQMYNTLSALPNTTISCPEYVPGCVVSSLHHDCI